MTIGRGILFSSIVLVTATIVSSSPVFADWQYTTWGMTLDQTLSASKGALKRCDPISCKGQTSEKDTARLYGKYRPGEFEFTAFAYFNNSTNKLSRVILRLTEPSQSNSLIGALRNKYGEPTTTNRTQIMQLLVWRENKDQISLLIIGIQGSGTTESADVLYQPRMTDSNKGL
jgi:hypothetical protein